jgi:molybdopterin converting factor subunit 1
MAAIPVARLVRSAAIYATFMAHHPSVLPWNRELSAFCTGREREPAATIPSLFRQPREAYPLSPMNTFSSTPLPARPLALPNLLTYARIAAVPVVVALMYWESILDGGLWLRWAALAVFIAAGITDVLDGYFARMYGQQSSLGRMLDPIADKLLVASCLLMLAAEETIRGWSLLAAVIILCREILVSGVAAGEMEDHLAARRRRLPDRRRCGRQDRFRAAEAGRLGYHQYRTGLALALGAGHALHRLGLYARGLAAYDGLEHFPAKCEAVRRRKCDQCKSPERVSDSEGMETALGLILSAGDPIFGRDPVSATKAAPVAMNQPAPMSTMKLVYFAWVRERVGKAEEEVELPASVTTVAELMRWLRERGEEYAHAFENPKVIRAAIDKSHVRPDTAIAGAREVAFFPPMTGG